MIDTAGAPTDQGQSQGEALRDRVAAQASAARASLPWLAWRRAQRNARRTSARAVATQLPWQHERLEGIARGAGRSVGALQVCEAWQRVSGTGQSREAVLEACLEIPPALEAHLVLRTSRPDAGGFGSVELTSAAWSGCLAGVNGEGLGVICLQDRDWKQASLRFLAQEFLFRARDLDAGIEHLRRRGAYLGGSGVLLLGDASGDARLLHLDEGKARLETPSPSSRTLAEPTVRIDLAARRLESPVGEGTAPASEIADGLA